MLALVPRPMSHQFGGEEMGLDTPFRKAKPFVFCTCSMLCVVWEIECVCVVFVVSEHVS